LLILFRSDNLSFMCFISGLVIIVFSIRFNISRLFQVCNYHRYLSVHPCHFTQLLYPHFVSSFGGIRLKWPCSPLHGKQVFYCVFSFKSLLVGMGILGGLFLGLLSRFIHTLIYPSASNFFIIVLICEDNLAMFLILNSIFNFSVFSILLSFSQSRFISCKRFDFFRSIIP